MWCGDVVVSNCVLVVLSSYGEPCRHAAFSCRGRLVVAVSSCGGPCLKSVPVSYDKFLATGKSGAFNDRARPLLKMVKIWRLFGEPLGHVIAPYGQILVSQKMAMRDEPNIQIRCSLMSRNTCCTDETTRLTTTPPSPPSPPLPCVHSTRPRVSTQHVPVCTCNTSPCIPAPRAHVEKHVDVVPVHTGTF